MPLRDALPPILRGDHAELTLQDRETLERLADEAQDASQAAWLRDECAGRLKQGGGSVAVEYLLAEACRAHGEVERAHQTLLNLGERLAADKRWEPLAAVAERALLLEETQAAARLLIRAHEGLAKDPERLDALQRAWVMTHQDLDVGLLLAVRLGEAGRGDDRRALLAHLLPRFAEDGRNSGLEEVALEFAEHSDLDALVRLIQTLPSVRGEDALRECRQLLDIAFPRVAQAERAAECLAALRALVARAAEELGPTGPEMFREATLVALKQGPVLELPDAAPVLRAARLDDPAVALPAALERFDAIAALAPGRAVVHGSFGAGRVASNDGEVVTIDFAHARGHRMPYAAARRTLTSIADDDLRLMRATDPARLARVIADAPAEVVLRALVAVGGEADAQKLKVFLVGSDLIKATEWTAFWRRARAAIEKDPRIDNSRAFEQRYGVADRLTSEADAPLPAVEPRKPIKANLTTLRKFLAQHPGAEPALIQRFGRMVSKAVLDPEGDRVDRARAGLYFARWFPERREEFADVLRELWEQGLAVVDLSTEDEQLALLDASHAAGVEADAILSALDSRFPAVRARAADLQAHLDDSGRAEMRRTLLAHASRYPSAALRLIDDELTREGPPQEGWRLLRGALTLIEQTPKPSVAEKILRWLEPGGAFDGRLNGTPCPEDTRLQLRVLLRQWRSSDRFLFPALDAVDRLGLPDEAEAVRGHRQKRSAKLFDRVGQQVEDAELVVMTRATWDRLKRELDRLERELRTTIPQAIQKARELGDLRENAEFHSAKLKQSNVGKLVASLQQRLSRARFVDDAEFRDGIVGLGAEVVLESDAHEITRFWILGEEEHHHGEHVISFQAPVGRSLMGHAIGDEVELGEGAGRTRYRIVSIERRLPAVETEAGS